MPEAREIISLIAMGLSAGAPVGFVAFRNLAKIASHTQRAIVALECIADRLSKLERIADKLESADIIKLKHED